MTKIEKKRGPRPIYRVEKKVRSLQAKDSTAGAMELAAPLTLLASKRGGRLKDPGFPTYHKRPCEKG
jgi:hypothetical protein